MKYLVHVRPPAELVEKMQVLLDSTQVAERYLKLPHCTVMRVRSSMRNERQIVSDVRTIASSTSAFPLFTDELDMYSEGDGATRTILCLRLQRSEALYEFHQQCLASLVKYIDWEETRAALRTVPDSERWRKYGDAFYGDIFSAHITLAKMAPAIFAALDKRQFAGFAWRVDKMYLSRRDREGWTTVAEFPLA